MNNFQHLEWDSNFFEYQVGKLSYVPDMDVEGMLQKKRQEGYRLVYLFSTEKIPTTHFLADEKVTFACDLTEYEAAESWETYKESHVSPKLLQLAWDSGHYSRYKLDPLISEERFKRLYELWIINSVNKSFADEVLIHSQGGELAGMISVKARNEWGSIGLIAVDSQYRSQGIGKKLVEDAKAFTKSKGCVGIEVQTQLQNKRACKFYEENGFDAKAIQFIYHCWL